MNWPSIFRRWYRPQIRYNNIIPLYLQYAIKEMGVSEIPGDEENPRINEYHAICNMKGEDRGWCSSFLCWCMAQSGIKHPGSALARSWLTWGSPVYTPEIGDICVFKRGNEAWMGHSTLFMGQTDNIISCLGGNQDNKVKISSYTESRLLGFRRPSIL